MTEIDFGVACAMVSELDRLFHVAGKHVRKNPCREHRMLAGHIRIVKSFENAERARATSLFATSCDVPITASAQSLTMLRFPHGVITLIKLLFDEMLIFSFAISRELFCHLCQRRIDNTQRATIITMAKLRVRFGPAYSMKPGTLHDNVLRQSPAG